MTPERAVHLPLVARIKLDGFRRNRHATAGRDQGPHRTTTSHQKIHKPAPGLNSLLDTGHQIVGSLLRKKEHRVVDRYRTSNDRTRLCHGSNVETLAGTFREG